MRHNIFPLFLIICIMSSFAYGQPSGAVIQYNTSETKTPASAQYLNTSGGTFTTLILSAESQNLKWKAYAGNVSGVLTLDDSGDYSIFQWELSEITGRVFATRNESITWSNIGCASQANIYSEETLMNHTSEKEDSINTTFSLQLHREFYVGTKRINESTCRSAFTWANNTAQTPSIDSPYQEVLLHDTSSMVYATFIDDDAVGFNFKNYDFQMIVPEKGVGGYENTRYYFYLELE
jgi:hypothetical protein